MKAEINITMLLELLNKYCDKGVYPPGLVDFIDELKLLILVKKEMKNEKTGKKWLFLQQYNGLFGIYYYEGLDKKDHEYICRVNDFNLETILAYQEFIALTQGGE